MERSNRMTAIRTNLAWDTLLPIDSKPGSGPLHARLTQALRELITSGRLQVGSALPPSRQLAADLGCSRGVITEAYAQLVAEGYLDARVGSGTRVRLRDQDLLAVAQPLAQTEPPRFDLRPGVADLRAFPRAAWMRSMREMLSTLPATDLGYPPPGGHPRLRQLISEYLGRVRGAVCSAEDVTITTGILDGITQLTRALARAGHRTIGIENPCWDRLSLGVRRTGITIVPIDVDFDGMRTRELSASNVRCVIVAPAHQYPTGVVLTSDRRAELISWVRECDGLILEDDYDAEFRYDRRQIGALQGMEPDHVALFGSLSKTIAPGLGLGWTLTPPRWTESLRAAETRATGPSIIEQLTLARFIETGAYDRQLRSLRRTYRARRDCLLAALARHLPDWQVTGAASGLHVLARLPDGIEGSTVAEVARERGVWLLNLRSCLLDDQTEGRDRTWSEGLVIGYGNLDDRQVEEAVRELTNAYQAVRPRPTGV